MKKLLLMDFGSRFTLDIQNTLDKLNIEYETVLHDYDFSLLSEDIKGIIISGSKDAVYDNGRRCDRKFMKSRIPVLAICYGHQLVNDDFGGKVRKSLTPEFDCGAQLVIDVDNPIFNGMNKIQNVSMFHNDEVCELGEGFVSLAHTDKCKYAASYNKEYNVYSVQFHPECRDYSDYSEEYFLNFKNICNI